MKKDIKFSTRMASADREVIKELAKRSGMSMSDYRGKVVGGIYDDRFLVKPTKSAVAMMPDTNRELPYDGAKEIFAR